jgi:ribosomal protein S27AE
MEPVRLDAASLAAIPEPLTACGRCGYLGVRPPRISDGVYAVGGELLSLVVCPRCGHQGLPVRFDRRADYAGFVEELNRGRPRP